MGRNSAGWRENEVADSIADSGRNAILKVSATENSGMIDTSPGAHIVYCESRMFLDRGRYGSWREIQDAYEDYKASLGPSSESEIVEFLEDDWGPDDKQWPFTRQAIADFFRSEAQLLMSKDFELL
jgi:hypothetical protein